MNSDGLKKAIAFLLRDYFHEGNLRCRAGTGWKIINRSGPAGNRPVGITWPTGEIPVKPVKNRRKNDEFF
jgi:hypothetical protein